MPGMVPPTRRTLSESGPILAAAIGDSITYADAVNAYWQYVTWLSGGKIVIRREAGVPGAQSTTITNRLLDEVLCYSGLQLAFGMQGTNDVGNSVPAATTLQNDASFIEACRGYGVTPVVLGLPPRSDNSSYALLTLTLNALKAAQCASLGAIFVDVLPALGSATTGQYLSASYTSDNLHPSQIGTRLIAQAILATLATRLPLYGSATAVIANDYGNPVTNPLFETDNGAGKANNWTFFGTTAGKTTSIVTDSEARGRWQRISWTTGATAGQAFLNQSVNVSQFRGRRVAFVGRMRTSGLEAGGGSVTAQIANNTDGGAMSPFSATAIDGDGLFYVEGFIPASATTVTVQFGYTAAASIPGPVTVDIAEIGVVLAPRADRGLIGTRSGRVPKPGRNVTAAYTITPDDELIFVDATAAAVTITLPLAAGGYYINSGVSSGYGIFVPSAGLDFTVIKTDASANAVTLAAAGSDTINGAATQTISTQYGKLKAHAQGGTKWILT